MKAPIKYNPKHKLVKEGISDVINTYIGAFFDAYKKGLEKQFIDKARSRNPELANTLLDLNRQIDATINVLRSKKTK